MFLLYVIALKVIFSMQQTAADTVAYERYYQSCR